MYGTSSRDGALHKRKPNLNYFKLWGCVAYVRLSDYKRSKLGPRTTRCAFLGYATNSKAYRFLDLESNAIIESRDAEFFENISFKDSKNCESSCSKQNFIEEKNSLNENVNNNVNKDESENDIEIRKSKRVRRTKEFGSDFVTFLVEGSSKNHIVHEFAFCFNMNDEPSTFEEAMKSRDVIF